MSLVAIAVSFGIGVVLVLLFHSRDPYLSPIERGTLLAAPGLAFVTLTELIGWFGWVAPLTFLGMAGTAISGLEVALRKTVRANGGIRFGDGVSELSAPPTGAQVSLEEARAASCDYPYAYMTAEFHESMQSSNITGERGIRDRNRNRSETHLHVDDGIRRTVGNPPHPEAWIACYGGSTTYNEETPDDLTWCSFLQTQLNSIGCNLGIVNHGVRGATAVDRCQYLRNSLDRSDLRCAVLFFGVNDCGDIGLACARSVFGVRRGPLRWALGDFAHVNDAFEVPYGYADPLIFKLLRLSARHSEILRWVQGEIEPSLIRLRARRVVKQTVSAFKDLERLLGSERVIFVLQPNLYSRKQVGTYEERLRKRFSPTKIEQYAAAALPRYRVELQGSTFFDATDLFDRMPESVYLDWMHVNARGNEMIADYIFRLLVGRSIVRTAEQGR